MLADILFFVIVNRAAVVIGLVAAVSTGAAVDHVKEGNGKEANLVTDAAEVKRGIGAAAARISAAEAETEKGEVGVEIERDLGIGDVVRVGISAVEAKIAGNIIV